MIKVTQTWRFRRVYGHRIIVLNTAVFGPTNFIGTTTTPTVANTMARMKKRKISKFRFLNLDF